MSAISMLGVLPRQRLACTSESKEGLGLRCSARSACYSSAANCAHKLLPGLVALRLSQAAGENRSDNATDGVSWMAPDL